MLKRLLPIFIIAFVFFGLVNNADARVAYLLKGSGWASVGNGIGIGWIKFSSSTEGGVGSSLGYGVKIEDTGLMSGEAWAGAGYGWLSFNSSDLTGCPSGVCEARVNLGNGDLSGWARFLTPKNNPGGAWDGWVKLRGMTLASSDVPASRTANILDKISNFFNNLFNVSDVQAVTAYGVNLNMSTLKFSGVAWGGDVAGWIAFGPPECTNCTVRAVATNQVPVVSAVSVEQPVDSWCSDAPFYRVRWNYSDGDAGDVQVSAIIKFVKVGDGTVSFTDTVTGLDASCGIGCTRRLENPLAQLSANTSYRVEIVSSDGKDSSAPALSAATTTPTHYYPLVNFSWTPNPAGVGARETFSNNTTNRSGGLYPSNAPAWVFTNANIVNATSQSPVVNFRSLPADVLLTVSDSSNASCQLQQQITGTGVSGVKRRIFRER